MIIHPSRRTADAEPSCLTSIQHQRLSRGAPPFPCTGPARRWVRLKPAEVGSSYRGADTQFTRAQHVLEKAGIPFTVLAERLATNSSTALLSTMHLAKGLEFRTVAVLACDDDVLPLKERLEAAGDDSDLEEINASERSLLYAACTRARDQLFVGAVKPGSEFLDDLRS